MGAHPHIPLRPVSQTELQTLQRVAKASSCRGRCIIGSSQFLVIGLKSLCRLAKAWRTPSSSRCVSCVFSRDGACAPAAAQIQPFCSPRPVAAK